LKNNKKFLKEFGKNFKKYYNNFEGYKSKMVQIYFCAVFRILKVVQNLKYFKTDAFKSGENRL